MNIQVARITKLYFHVDENKHTVAEAKQGESYASASKNFKALVFVDKNLDEINANGGFWLDGYGGQTPYCAVKSFLVQHKGN